MFLDISLLLSNFYNLVYPMCISHPYLRKFLYLTKTCKKDDSISETNKNNAVIIVSISSPWQILQVFGQSSLMLSLVQSGVPYIHQSSLSSHVPKFFEKEAILRSSNKFLCVIILPIIRCFNL